MPACASSPPRRRAAASWLSCAACGGRWAGRALSFVRGRGAWRGQACPPRAGGRHGRPSRQPSGRPRDRARSSWSARAPRATGTSSHCPRTCTGATACGACITPPSLPWARIRGCLPLGSPPLRREHRLYQADWLLRFYGFSAAEVLDEGHPFLELDLDPKTAWALRNRGRFPVEVSRAGYEELLRVPGLGQKSARRIVDARRHGRVGFDTLESIGVVMKRARWFLTCGGRSLDRLELGSEEIRLRLRQAETGEWAHGQLPLFDPRDPAAGCAPALQGARALAEVTA